MISTASPLSTPIVSNTEYATNTPTTTSETSSNDSDVNTATSSTSVTATDVDQALPDGGNHTAEESQPSTDPARDASAANDPPPPRNSAPDSASDTAAAVPPSDNDVDMLADLLHKLEVARENLINVPEGDDEQRAMKLLDLAGVQYQYLNAADAKDEGALIEALGFAAQAEGLFSPTTLLCGSSMYTQMNICYYLYRDTGNVDWLHKGIEFGVESANIITPWQETTIPDLFRRHFALRATQIAWGYKTLHAEDKEEKSIYEALMWQGRTASATTREDSMNDGKSEWELKYERDSGWALLWDDFSELTNRYDLQPVIDHLIAVYPRTLVASSAEQHCFFRILYLECRQWAITRQQDLFDDMMARTVEIRRWNEDTHMYDRLWTDQWSQDLDNPQHVLKSCMRLFQTFSQLFIPNSARHDKRADIETAIILWKELRSRYKYDTFNDLDERAELLEQMGELYLRRYELTKVTIHGWEYDDLMFEISVLNILRGMLEYNGYPRDAPISHGIGRFRLYNLGVSVVTGQTYETYMVDGSVSLNYRFGGNTFKRDLETLHDPFDVADCIRGYDGDQWQLGGEPPEHLELILDFVRQNFTPGLKTAESREQLRQSHLSRRAQGLSPQVTGMGFQPSVESEITSENDATPNDNTSSGNNAGPATSDDPSTDSPPADDTSVPSKDVVSHDTPVKDGESSNDTIPIDGAQSNDDAASDVKDTTVTP